MSVSGVLACPDSRLEGVGMAGVENDSQIPPHTELSRRLRGQVGIFEEEDSRFHSVPVELEVHTTYQVGTLTK